MYQTGKPLAVGDPVWSGSSGVSQLCRVHQDWHISHQWLDHQLHRSAWWLQSASRDLWMGQENGCRCTWIWRGEEFEVTYMGTSLATTLSDFSGPQWNENSNEINGLRIESQLASVLEFSQGLLETNGSGTWPRELCSPAWKWHHKSFVFREVRAYWSPVDISAVL